MRIKRYVVVFISFYMFVFTLDGVSERIIPLENLPQPASGSYFVTSAPLTDGTFLIWNGNEIFKQTTPANDNFSLITSGYIGDPGFIAISPDGKKAILGQGYLGNLYLLDLDNPQDFTPSSIVGNISHYYGIFLTEDLLLLDITKLDFSGSEIHVLSVFTKNVVDTKLIVSKPQHPNKEMVIDKPPYAYSATLAIDNDWVYIMDANTRELRKFNIQNIVNAYEGNYTLDWETDGTLIGNTGMYFTGGVSGVTNDGYLIIGGSAGFMLPGGIQEVNPTTGEIIKIWDPANNQGYYSAFYNSFSDTILTIVNNNGYLVLRNEQEECPDCIPKRKSFYRTGEDICLDIFGENLPPNTTFTWTKEGESLDTNPRVYGIHCRHLLIYNAQVEDSGTYICSYNSEKKIFKIKVNVTDQQLSIKNNYLLFTIFIFLVLTAVSKIIRVIN
ncbi:MAG: hypothetical protein LDL53_07025 [Candidatus Hydrogenedens sp.]|nr:hypothetical protein [Candidatus Hydrogenedens sp.]